MRCCEPDEETTGLTYICSGFAGKYPLTLTQSVTAWSDEYHATVEKDQIVSAFDGGSS